MIEATTLKYHKLNNYTESLLYFLASRLFFGFIILLGEDSLGSVFKLFDAEHYISIAKNGYHNEALIAFFPLLPVIIKFTGVIGAILINNVCFYFSIVILKKLDLSRILLAAVAFSPIGFFSMLLYTESMFFFLSVVVYYLYTKNKLPLLMGVLLGLSVCNRSTGSLLFFAVFIAMCVDFYKKRTPFKNIIITYVPATLISLIYPVYLQVKFGNWKLFMDTQYDNWYRISSNIFKTEWISLKMLFTDAYPFEDTGAMLVGRLNEAITNIILIILVALVVSAITKQVKSGSLNTSELLLIVYAILSIVVLGATIRVPEVDAPTVSFYRYYYGIISLFILGNNVKPNAQKALFAFTITLSFITAFVFCKGLYFY